MFSLLLSEIVRGFSVKNLLLKVSQNAKEIPVYRVCTCIFIKKRLRHRCFPANLRNFKEHILFTTPRVNGCFWRTIAVIYDCKAGYVFNVFIFWLMKIIFINKTALLRIVAISKNPFFDHHHRLIRINLNEEKLYVALIAPCQTQSNTELLWTAVAWTR